LRVTYALMPLDPSKL